MTNTEEIETAIRALKAAYAKEWRRKNPDKVRANNRRYWERQAIKMMAAEAKKS